MFFVTEYLSSLQNPHYEQLMQVLQTLQADADRDVHYFANFPFDMTDTRSMLYDHETVSLSYSTLLQSTVNH